MSDAPLNQSRSPAGAPLVIKIGGSTLDDHLHNQALWHSIASLSSGEAEQNGGVIIVHGGGKAVDRQLSRLGIVSERRQGLRVTPPDQIGDVVGVLAGQVNKSLVGSLLVAGARPVGLCLGDGDMLMCEKHEPQGVDLGRVGAVKGGDCEILRTLIANGFLPVVSSIGLDDEGQFLNINADDAAAGIAEALQATSLVLLTDVPGIRNRAGALCPQLTPTAIEQMIADREISGGMIVKARAAAGVATRAAIRVVILSGEDPAHLIGWIGGQTVGTSIVPEGRTASPRPRPPISTA